MGQLRGSLWVLGLGLLVMTAALADGDEHRRPVVTVVGTGSVAAAPDTIEFQVGATTGDKTAVGALERNSEIISRMRGALTKLGVAPRDVQTSRFDVVPEYDRRSSNEQPALVGYRVNHMLSIRFGDMDKAGALLDSVIHAGANLLQGVRFSVAEPKALMSEALALAVADATAKAQTLAQAAGLKLGAIRKIAEGVYDSPRALLGGAMEMRAASAVPIAGGEQDFSVQVTIVFELAES